MIAYASWIFSFVTFCFVASRVSCQKGDFRQTTSPKTLFYSGKNSICQKGCLQIEEYCDPMVNMCRKCSELCFDNYGEPDLCPIICEDYCESERTLGKDHPNCEQVPLSKENIQRWHKVLPQNYLVDTQYADIWSDDSVQNTEASTPKPDEKNDIPTEIPKVTNREKADLDNTFILEKVILPVLCAVLALSIILNVILCISLSNLRSIKAKSRYYDEKSFSNYCPQKV